MELKLAKPTIVTHPLLALPFYCHILLLCQWFFLLCTSAAEGSSGPAMRKSQGLLEPPADQLARLDQLLPAPLPVPHLLDWNDSRQATQLCHFSFFSQPCHSQYWFDRAFCVTELAAIPSLFLLPTRWLQLFCTSEKLEKQFLKPERAVFPSKRLLHIES